MTKIVYKITVASDWRKAMQAGRYSGSADDIRDGFIHLSEQHQLQGTLEKHFKHERDLMLIAFEEKMLGPALRWEQSRGGELFPHLYTNLQTSHVLWERPLLPGADGALRFDDRWFEC